MNSSLSLADLALTRCKQLASFSQQPDALTRTFLSAPFHECHQALSQWMTQLDMQVRVDAIGNLRGIYPGKTSTSRRLLLGSHIDTVPNAGAYDGVLGVMIGLALLQSLEGRRLPFAIELIAFSEEEGVRFGVPFLGSRALIGDLTEADLERPDARLITIHQAIEDFGLNPAEIKDCAIHPGEFIGFLEFHIEQGPILESQSLALGIVDAIVGQSRWSVEFMGEANHAGTTPTRFRRDALAAAAEWILQVERCAESTEGLAATVGKLQVFPNAGNVIPGRAIASLDIRHHFDEVRVKSVAEVLDHAITIAARRQLQVNYEEHLNRPATVMNSTLIAKLETAVAKAGCQPFHMVSGAGHDAMILAERVPSAMLFLRSPGGISHHPSETVLREDVAAAIQTGILLLEELGACITERGHI